MTKIIKSLILTALVVTVGFGAYQMRAAEVDFASEGCNLGSAKVASIDTEFKTLDKTLYAKFKGCEIAKLNSVTKTVRADYSIEVVSFDEKEYGVDVFAKVWDSNGDLIGFGKDGTVEIERFQIVNPPVLVSDSMGMIERIEIHEGKEIIHKYREDIKEAVLQVLEQNLLELEMSGELSDSSKIISGKIGSTVTTCFPAAGQNEPVDGRVFRVSGGEAFSTMHDQPGTGAVDTNTAEDAARIVSGGATDKWSVFVRSIYGCDLSAIPDSDVISSGTFSVYSNSGSSADNFAQDVVLDRNVPISTSALASGDYNIARWDDAEQASNRIDLGDWVSGDQYRVWTLNATGKGNVSKVALTWLGIRVSSDFDDLGGPTWSSSLAATANGFYADNGGAGTTQDPRFQITHAAPVVVTGGGQQFMMGMSF